MGFTLLKKKGIQPAIVYASDSPIVNLIADDLGIKYRYEDVTNKLELAQELCLKENISINDVAFIRDDTNDLELMENAGLAACPSNVPSEIRNKMNILVLKKRGGKGAVREFVDYILENGFC